MAKKYLNYVPVVIWMIIIFSISSIPELPSNNVDILDFTQKKLAHFLEYAVLFILWFRALGKKNPTPAIIYSLIYAFTDEIHQLLVPGRTGMLRDVAIDLSGIIITAFLIIKFDLWKKLISPLPLKKPEK